jgi:hypothetical protein
MIGPLSPGPHVIEAGSLHTGFPFGSIGVTNNINVPPPIPAMSLWDLCLMGVALLAMGCVALRSRPA